MNMDPMIRLSPAPISAVDEKNPSNPGHSQLKIPATANPVATALFIPPSPSILA
jgi:hypothetical protein